MVGAVLMGSYNCGADISRDGNYDTVLALEMDERLSFNAVFICSDSCDSVRDRAEQPMVKCLSIGGIVPEMVEGGQIFEI